MERDPAGLSRTAPRPRVVRLLRHGELQDERLAECLEEVGHLPSVGRGDPHVGEVRAHGQDRGVEEKGGQAGRTLRDRTREKRKPARSSAAPARDARARRRRARYRPARLPVAPARARGTGRPAA